MVILSSKYEYINRIHVCNDAICDESRLPRIANSERLNTIRLAKRSTVPPVVLAQINRSVTDQNCSITYCDDAEDFKLIFVD